ncbi:uncharacterized protein LOC123502642 [Portunus trituberculatus]|uniref:uncharacterized protein LOC123502642 n=1 Tax=Portunus trituberculatus TaxID=210409 RepID=UPI001E1D163C|nr:uncharacterized protein LOC123502642 [Portunus trituberculatus]
MSSGGERPGSEKQEYYRQRRLSSYILRRGFIRDCLEEQVLPKSAPKQLTSKNVPFSDSARAYLREALNTLTDEINALRESGSTDSLPLRLKRKLREEERQQREKLTRKLKELCSHSKWNNAGRLDIIQNLSNTPLNETEMQALSLGLKFDSGQPRFKYNELLNKNYNWKEKDVDKGFKQGVIACYQAIAEDEEPGLPRRFRTALEDLGRRTDIVITQADKGGGVVVMKRTEYVDKMQQLLSDSNTYKKTRTGFAEKEAAKFSKEVRKILSRTDRGKKLIGFLEEAPRPPRMRGLPKLHKPGVPMRPITSGIGSAPHRLAKVLAKPLSVAMGTISSAHLRNSTDLIERIRHVDLAGKKMASFDVKALFTNVPVVGAMKAVQKVIESVSESELPVNKTDYIKLVSLCVKFGCFTFGEEEFVQHRGLAMGSPKCSYGFLYMELLESESLVRVMGSESLWFRYVDDIIVIMPTDTNVNDKLCKLNEVNEHIQFTVEEEVNGVLPFLDIRHSNRVLLTCLQSVQ